MASWMKQGDAFELPVRVSLNGELLEPEALETLEVCVGSVRKLYPGAVTWSREDGCYYVPLTQEETLGFPAGEAVNVDVRARFVGGKVLGVKKMGVIIVYDAISEEVL